MSTVDSIKIQTWATGIGRSRGSTELIIKETRTVTLIDHMTSRSNPDTSGWFKSLNLSAAFRVEPDIALGVRSVPIHTLSAEEKSRRQEWHGMTHDMFVLILSQKKAIPITT